MSSLEKRLAQAVKHFWLVRESQRQRQGVTSGRKDYGSRSAVTGGAHLDGFADLVKELLVESGLSAFDIYHKRKTVTLPGYYRPTKNWDLIVVSHGQLIATIELKSHIGSFGNNVNNRVEEALGNATDIWAAYREGAFSPSQQPWLGYFMLLEKHQGSTRPVRVVEPHFRVFDEFRNMSYAKRYEILCQRLVRTRLYDSACLLMADREGGLRGKYVEPNAELSFRNFVLSLTSRATAFAKTFK